MFFETTGLYSPELVSVMYSSDQEEDSSPVATQSLEEETPMCSNSDHVVFVIHGIGQQTEQYGMFEQNMQSLRDTMRQVLQTRMPGQEMQIKMIPIEWHRHIHQETDPAIHRILPKSIPTLRMIETDYLADVLYYFSPNRGESILRHVTQEFNAAYDTFMKEQPNFCGKIAILGYSLGGLISWDMLAHQRTVIDPVELEHQSRFDVKVPRLDFMPDYLFGMGCPVAGLLVARNQDPRHYHPDDSVVFENIYHPYDPLAFRIEPLLNEEFTDTPAVTVERAQPSSGSLLGYLSSAVWQFFGSAALGEPRSASEISRRASAGDILISRKDQDFLMLQRSNSMPDLAKEKLKPMLSQHQEDDNASDTASSCSSCESSPPATPLPEEEKVRPWTMDKGRRFDYELTPETGVMSNEYILGLSAHFSYWTNKDMLWHIFCRMENI
ncbi:hypothetical protein LRAMOSA00261 [Lichtheimia ramosa]|uniref:DDHD domain-containing protein n=1 Tax=Lichtheimia ramosa TaxID=688394 RepID=A0A077W9T2_9FUNG|nr:hypothetical protein LRAMOSA00261 [Lichtheimia ramosa]